MDVDAQSYNRVYSKARQVVAVESVLGSIKAAAVSAHNMLQRDLPLRQQPHLLLAEPSPVSART